MLLVSMTEARKNFERLIERVESGELVVLTRWGRPVADLVPRPSQPSDINPEEVTKPRPPSGDE